MARIYVTEKQLDKIIELLEKDLSRSLEQGLINYLKRVRRDEIAQLGDQGGNFSDPGRGTNR
jgi:hypothetical protein